MAATLFNSKALPKDIPYIYNDHCVSNMTPVDLVYSKEYNHPPNQKDSMYIGYLVTVVTVPHTLIVINNLY